MFPRVEILGVDYEISFSDLANSGNFSFHIVRANKGDSILILKLCKHSWEVNLLYNGSRSLEDIDESHFLVIADP